MVFIGLVQEGLVAFGVGLPRDRSSEIESQCQCAATKAIGPKNLHLASVHSNGDDNEDVDDHPHRSR